MKLARPSAALGAFLATGPLSAAARRGRLRGRPAALPAESTPRNAEASIPRSDGDAEEWLLAKNKQKKGHDGNERYEKRSAQDVRRVEEKDDLEVEEAAEVNMTDIPLAVKEEFFASQLFPLRETNGRGKGPTFGQRKGQKGRQGHKGQNKPPEGKEKDSTKRKPQGHYKPSEGESDNKAKGNSLDLQKKFKRCKKKKKGKKKKRCR